AAGSDHRRRTRCARPAAEQAAIAEGAGGADNGKRKHRGDGEQTPAPAAARRVVVELVVVRRRHRAGLRLLRLERLRGVRTGLLIRRIEARNMLRVALRVRLAARIGEQIIELSAKLRGMLLRRRLRRQIGLRWIRCRRWRRPPILMLLLAFSEAL